MGLQHPRKAAFRKGQEDGRRHPWPVGSRREQSGIRGSTEEEKALFSCYSGLYTLPFSGIRPYFFPARQSTSGSLHPCRSIAPQRISSVVAAPLFGLAGVNTRRNFLVRPARMSSCICPFTIAHCVRSNFFRCPAVRRFVRLDVGARGYLQRHFSVARRGPKATRRNVGTAISPHCNRSSLTLCSAIRSFIRLGFDARSHITYRHG